MVEWQLTDIEKAVSGKLVNAPASDVTITGIHMDSRKIKTGALFVPLIAERNGHEFIEDAVKQGAKASFWSDSLEKAPADVPLIVVEDTEKAFRDFAQWHLNNVAPKVIGITGSNGKTTTKDMVAAVLSTTYQVHKTHENLNNELGVPLTILTMPANTEMLVVEMGMSEPGEISVLSHLTEPDIAVITMIGESHIEAFGSRKKLAAEKLDILTGLKAGGLFIHPENEPLFTNEAAATRELTFGEKMGADIYAYDVAEKRNETQFAVGSSGEDADQTLKVKLPIPGKYNVQNALIAILVGLKYEVPLENVKAGLENLTLTKNRLEWLAGENDVSLLNDAYNASPTSMKAALAYFENITIDGEKIVVLGDILELGDRSQAYHESIAETVSLDAYKAVYLYGEEMKALDEKLQTRPQSEKVKHYSENKEPLITSIKQTARPGDAILFKSSNGTDLLAVVDTLRQNQDKE